MADTLLAHTVTPLGEGVALHSLIIKAAPPAPTPADGAAAPPPPPPPPALWTYVEAIWTSTGRREYAGHCAASGVGFRGWSRPGALPVCTPFATTAACAGSPTAPPLPQRAGEALLGFPALPPASVLALPAPSLAPLLALLGAESAAAAAALPTSTAAAALAEVLAPPLAAWLASCILTRGGCSASTNASPATAAKATSARSSRKAAYGAHPLYQCRNRAHGDSRTLDFGGPVFDDLASLQLHVATYLSGDWSRRDVRPSMRERRQVWACVHACGSLFRKVSDVKAHHKACLLTLAHPGLFPWAFGRFGPLPPLESAGGDDDGEDGDEDEDGSAAALQQAADAPPGQATNKNTVSGSDIQVQRTPAVPAFSCMHLSHSNMDAPPPAFSTAAELRAHVKAEHASGPWPWTDLSTAMQQHQSSWVVMCAGCGWTNTNYARNETHAAVCRALLAQPAGQPRFYTRADALASPDFGYRCSHRSHYEPGFVAADIPCFVTPQAPRGHVMSAHFTTGEEGGEEPWWSAFRSASLIKEGRPWKMLCAGCGRLESRVPLGDEHAGSCGALAAYDAEPRYYVAGE